MRGRRRVVAVSAAILPLLLLRAMTDARATVPPPPPRCGRPSVALAPAPIAAGQTAGRLSWSQAAQRPGVYSAVLRRTDGTTIELALSTDAFGVLLVPAERIDPGPHLLEYGDECGGPIEPIALDFVANRTTPTMASTQWDLFPGCGILPSVPAGARTFTARALLPDGMTLDPATTDFEVRCPDCPPPGQKPPPPSAVTSDNGAEETKDSGCSVARGRDAMGVTAVLCALALVGARLGRSQRRI